MIRHSAAPGASTIHRALDRSEFEAKRGNVPPIQIVRTTPARTWEIVTERLLVETRTEYLGFEDISLLAKADMTEHMVARGSRALDVLFRRRVVIGQLTTPAGVRARGPECPGSRLHNRRDARIVDRLPARAWVFDRRMAVMPLVHADLSDGMLVLTDPAVVDTLVKVHQSVWSLASAGACPSVTDEPDVPPTHLREIVRLLSAGLADEVAARQLGLSARTYSRRVGELLELLGVRTRFEAGVHAARRGWL